MGGEEVGDNCAEKSEERDEVGGHPEGDVGENPRVEVGVGDVVVDEGGI